MLTRAFLASAIAFTFSGAWLAAQCAPPAYTGPGDGPRPTGPADPGGSTTSTGKSTGAGDTSTKSPAGDPRTGGGTRTPGTGGRGGTALTFTRGTTSKKRLKIEWDYPKPQGEARLDFATALQEIRGSDPRPLLVLRECKNCGANDDAVLVSGGDNDKTYLLARYFHCVRVTDRVMQESHPWHALFAGNDPGHLFVASWDGKIVLPFPGTQTARELQGGMVQALRADYRKDPEAAVRDWLKLLNDLDTVDSQQADLNKQIDEITYKEGPRSERLKPLKLKLTRHEEKRAGILAAEKALLDLGLVRGGSVPVPSALLERTATK